MYEFLKVTVGGCSGSNVISATCGNIKFVLFLMVDATKVTVSIFAQNVVV